MNRMSDAFNELSNTTRTENGDKAYKTTNSAVLDFFAVSGALRGSNDDRVLRLFKKAYREDPLLSVKALFYTRDIRGGVGERHVSRVIYKWIGDKNPDFVKKNIDLFGEYGRYDDLYSFDGTASEDIVYDYMYRALKKDYNSENPSLLAKWIKSCDASSENTRIFAVNSALKIIKAADGDREFPHTIRDFKRYYKKIRKRIGIVESQMSANEWGKIDYEKVPSQAMSKSSRAFKRHDEDRFCDYIEHVNKGEKKMNAGAITPPDILSRNYWYNGWEGRFFLKPGADATTADAQWNLLRNYVPENYNAIVVADTSASMLDGKNICPIDVSVSLAFYFASHNSGPFKDLFMIFSKRPEFVRLHSHVLSKMIDDLYEVCARNTNLDAVFDQILGVAIKKKCSQDDFPKSIIIISDMEFDGFIYGYGDADNALDIDTSTLERARKKFEENGYSLPNIVFWNVRARHDTVPVQMNDYGVQLVSGNSPAIIRNFFDIIQTTPYEAMLRVLNSERYDPVRI